MPNTTDQHSWYYPADGDRDYEDTFETFFEQLDNDVEIRDTDTNKNNYDPKVGAKYVATDTEDVYIGDGNSWKHLVSTGKNPTFESVSTDALVTEWDRVIDSADDIEDLASEATSNEVVKIAQPESQYVIGEGVGGKFIDINVSDFGLVFESRFDKNGEPILKAGDGTDVGGFRFGANGTVSNIKVVNMGFDGNHPNQSQTVDQKDALRFEDARDFAVNSFFATRTSPYHEHGTGGCGIWTRDTCRNFILSKIWTDDIGDQSVRARGSYGNISKAFGENGYDRVLSMHNAVGMSASDIIGLNNADGSVVGVSGNGYNNSVENVVADGSRSAVHIASDGVRVSGVTADKTTSTAVRVTGSNSQLSDVRLDLNATDSDAILVADSSVENITFNDITVIGDDLRNAIRVTQGSDLSFTNIQIRGSNYSRAILDDVGCNYHDINVDVTGTSSANEIKVTASAVDARFWGLDNSGSLADTGTRTIVNGRYATPPTIDLEGSASTVISPTNVTLDEYDILVNGDGTTIGGTGRIVGIDSINQPQTVIRLINTGDDDVTLAHDSNTNGLLNQSGSSDTLSRGIAEYIYDGQQGKWVQTFINS